MQVSDIPVQKNELAVWAIVVYIYSLDLRVCAVFFETLVLILVCLLGGVIVYRRYGHGTCEANYS